MSMSTGLMRQVGCSRQPASRVVSDANVDEIPDGTHNERQDNGDHNNSQSATVTSKAMTSVLYMLNMTLKGESADFVAKNKNKNKNKSVSDVKLYIRRVMLPRALEGLNCTRRR
jgi:hypothetical protein